MTAVSRRHGTLVGPVEIPDEAVLRCDADWEVDEETREWRLAWESACLAEASLLQQRRRVRAHRYAGGQPLQPLLRVV